MMASPLISFVSPPTALENAGTSSAKQGEEKNAAVPNTPNSMAKTSERAGLRLDLIIILLNKGGNFSRGYPHAGGKASLRENCGYESKKWKFKT